MDLTAPNIIFSLRAICPGVSVPGSDAGPVLVIGDSIVNQVPEAYSACGYNVLRFAVNGMRGHDVIPFLGSILAKSQPSVVVVALGKNDQGTVAGTGLDTFWWIVKYIVNITAAQGRPLKPVLMTVLPTERAAPAPWNNPPMLQWYSDYIKAVGVAFGCDVVDFAATYPGIAPIVTDGPYLTPGFTWTGDGIYVHPVGPSNPLMWAYVQLAIEKGLSQAGLPMCAAPPGNAMTPMTSRDRPAPCRWGTDSAELQGVPRQVGRRWASGWACVATGLCRS